MGLMLAEIEKAKGGRPEKTGSRVLPVSNGHKLAAALHAAELKLLAERRLGELLERTARQGRPAKRLHGETISNGKLPEGITKIQSHRWQQVASVPEEQNREPGGSGLASAPTAYTVSAQEKFTTPSRHHPRNRGIHGARMHQAEGSNGVRG